MAGPKLLSDAVPKLTGKVFSRKYNMLGRLVTRWEDIVGKELAEKAVPVKLHFRKKKTAHARATASLDISCTSADAAALHYQKDLILERINQIFGERWVTAIRFVPMAANLSGQAAKPCTRRKTLSAAEKNNLSALLNDIEDPELKAQLEDLGTAILQDQTT
jgi:Uncharacterized protein conserved in bacteria